MTTGRASEGHLGKGHQLPFTCYLLLSCSSLLVWMFSFLCSQIHMLKFEISRRRCRKWAFGRCWSERPPAFWDSWTSPPVALSTWGVCSEMTESHKLSLDKTQTADYLEIRKLRSGQKESGLLKSEKSRKDTETDLKAPSHGPQWHWGFSRERRRSGQTALMRSSTSSGLPEHPKGLQSRKATANML